MRAEELISALIFISFWVLIYSIEIGYIFYFFKRKAIARRWFANVIHVVAVTGILCFAYSYFVEPYWLETKHIKITTDKLKKAELTIVQISDLHCDEKLRNEKSYLSL